jgi:hypothetical protein
VIWSDGHFYDNLHGFVLENGCEESRNDGCDVDSEIGVWAIETSPANMD